MKDYFGHSNESIWILIVDLIWFVHEGYEDESVDMVRQI